MLRWDIRLDLGNLVFHLPLRMAVKGGLEPLKYHLHSSSLILKLFVDEELGGTRIPRIRMVEREGLPRLGL